MPRKKKVERLPNLRVSLPRSVSKFNDSGANERKTVSQTYWQLVNVVYEFGVI